MGRGQQHLTASGDHMKRKALVPMIIVLILAVASVAMARNSYQKAGYHNGNWAAYNQLTPEKQQRCRISSNNTKILSSHLRASSGQSALNSTLWWTQAKPTKIQSMLWLRNFPISEIRFMPNTQRWLMKLKKKQVSPSPQWDKA